MPKYATKYYYYIQATTHTPSLAGSAIRSGARPINILDIKIILTFSYLH